MEIQDGDVDISLLPGGDSYTSAVWQKSAVDLVGQTKFTFDLSTTDSHYFAFVIQKEGLDA